MNEEFSVKKLKDLAETILGVNIPSSLRIEDGEWKIVRGRDIIEKSVLVPEISIKNENVKKYIKSITVPGDILISTQFEQYKIGIVPNNFPLAIAGSGVTIIRPNKIQKDYLYKYFTSKTGRNAIVGQLNKVVRGAVIKFVTLKDLAELDIPILPVEYINPPDRNLEKLREIGSRFENEITKYAKEQLTQKGWKENQIVIESKIAGGIRADIALIKNDKIVSLLEIKRFHKHPDLIKEQLKVMCKAVGIEKSYLISGEGIKEYNLKTNSFLDVNEFPLEKEAGI